jgi:H+/Cl- antiporter ClcA
MLDDSTRNVIHIVKWFFLATAIGVIVGGMDAAFLKLLDGVLALRQGCAYYYFLLPFALYIIARLAYKTAQKHRDFSTDSVIHKINAYEPVSLVSVGKAFFLSIATMVFGGSAGKEAPCADVGAGLAAFFGKLLHFSARDARKLMICGVSAGFAGVFGVPVAGALFGLEVLWVGHLFYEVMFPALVAGITAYQVTLWLGVNYIYHPIAFTPVLSEQFFLKMIVAGLFFGLISLLFIEINKFTRVVFRFIALRTRLFWACITGGLILVAFGYWVSPEYLGLGMAGINDALSGTPVSSPFGFIYKMITTAVTFAAGGVGGLITPVFFIGAQAGSVLAGFLHVDPATLAALGLAAVLAGTANTPLAATIMAIELFGGQIAPYAIVVCIISFLVTGPQSLFAHQRISWDSGKGETDSPRPVKFRRRATDRQEHLPHRKTLGNHLKSSVKHLLPLRKKLSKGSKDPAEK